MFFLLFLGIGGIREVITQLVQGQLETKQHMVQLLKYIVQVSLQMYFQWKCWKTVMNKNFVQS